MAFYPAWFPSSFPCRRLFCVQRLSYAGAFPEGPVGPEGPIFFHCSRSESRLFIKYRACISSGEKPWLQSRIRGSPQRGEKKLEYFK